MDDHLSLTRDCVNDIVLLMKLTLDRMSRLVLPKILRDRFALVPGQELEVAVEDDGFRLRPVQAVSTLAEKDGILVCTSELPQTDWDLEAFIDRERAQRSRNVGGV